jgi:hypothetical protein
MMQFWVKVTESRSKVASTRIFHAMHLNLQIHPPTKYQPKIFIRLGDRAEGNFGFKVTGSRSKVALTQLFCATHLCPLIHPPTKYQPKIISRLGIIEQKGDIRTVGGGHDLKNIKHPPQLMLAGCLISQTFK